MCTHHWMLDDPKGGEVPARCRECGVERIFKPGFMDVMWNHPVSAGYSIKRRPASILLSDEV